MLEIKKLSKTYKEAHGKITVLKDINLKIDAGKFIVLLGPSGSGKSTLLNLIAMLDKPDCGEVLLDGKNILRISEDKKAELRLNSFGFVFQFDSLLPEFTVLENIEFPAIMKGEQNNKVGVELLENFGLAKFSSKMPQTLSGGEKQRVAIMRALRNNPKIILADEPTGNLDAQKKTKIFKDFASLAKKGTSVLMVTHDTHACDFADEVYQLTDTHHIKKIK